MPQLIDKHHAFMVLHNKEGSSNKLYVVRVDEMSPGVFDVVGSYGKSTAAKLISQTKYAGVTRRSDAVTHMFNLANEKNHGGYKTVSDSQHYGVSIGLALTKIDCSRVTTLHNPNVSQPAQVTSKPPVTKVEIPDIKRLRRQLDI